MIKIYPYRHKLQVVDAEICPAVALNFAQYYPQGDMGRDKMIGVVLWSDPDLRQAVIWCEDHGDLAFFRDTVATERVELLFEAGDLVEFELTFERNIRYAHDLTVISEGSHRHLPDQVKTAINTECAPTFEGPRKYGGAKQAVVPFLRRKRTAQIQTDDLLRKY